MGDFKRYDGYVMNITQKFIDTNLPVCPFCHTDSPHWLLDSKIGASLSDNKVLYCCEKCQAIMSSASVEVSAEQVPDSVCLTVESAGTVFAGDNMTGSGFSLEQLKQMAQDPQFVPVAVVKPIIEQPAPQPQPVYEAPQPQQPYVAPQPQPVYEAPQPQQPYVAPQPQQQPYVAPQPQQQPYVAPQPQPQYNNTYTYSNPSQPLYQYTNGEPPKKTKVWSVFAKIGFILGIVSVVCAFIPYLNIAAVDVSIIGIVFSILGRKADDSKTKSLIGLITSIAALVISVLTIYIYIFSGVMDANLILSLAYGTGYDMYNVL